MEINDLKQWVVDDLRSLADALSRSLTAEERCALFESRGVSLPKRGSLEERAALAAVEVVGQAPLLKSLTPRLIEQLVEVDRFYASIGGIVGYQSEAVAQLSPSEEEESEEFHYSDPDLFEIRFDSPQRREAILEGVRRMSQMAEIFPVGGVGDRLGLRDPKSGDPLPVAALRYKGETLLSHLFRDLEARERLYAALVGSELVTPVVLMCSHEGKNRDRIVALCEEANWFGRPPDSFYFIVQPSVPVISAEGQWLQNEKGGLVTRPGGHGVLWKVMEEQGAYPWLAERGRSHALVRQINNPLAATDCTLLALSGLGWLGGNQFGFATCPRRVGASEGMVVAFSRSVDGGVERGISNIEYTHFARCHLEDLPDRPGSVTSRFPANTNILYVDLAAVRAVAERHPFPGRLVNLSKRLKAKGGLVVGGRLETTMQNVADHMTVGEGEPLLTFATYGDRLKTISVTKRAYEGGGKIEETPPGCHYDQLQTFCALLTECRVALPPLGTAEEYLAGSPGLFVEMAPLLGPLWSLIAQKVRGGQIEAGSHLHLALANLDWEGVRLNGSLVVVGEGSVTLRSALISNRGPKWGGGQPFWSGELDCLESLRIEVEAGGEFWAEGVEIRGGRSYHVRAGERLRITPEGEVREKLNGAAWWWEYHLDESKAILLKKERS